MLNRVIDAYPLATVISGGTDDQEITLLPLMITSKSDDHDELVGHLDCNNPQADQLTPGAAVSFVFHEPNAYASPDLYPDMQLPGWLYVMVKGKGVISECIRKKAIGTMHRGCD
jgi:predicted FMN-binding regulatory protein PaiB